MSRLVSWLLWNEIKIMNYRIIASLGIVLVSLGLTYAPLPGIKNQVIIVSGTELKEPLERLGKKFEQSHKNVEIELKFQGSQDIINNYLDRKNDFTPTVLIPANEELIQELGNRLSAQGESEPFYNVPQPLAKTILVGIAWPERGKVLFPTGRFQWQNIQTAMQKRNWRELGGPAEWGSFDFVTTDPTRSNSGQLTLSLWSGSKLGVNNLTPTNLNNPTVNQLFSLIKKSVYQPPRSTDILLQEFIARGPNDADVATVYESIAIYRWSQANSNQGKSYRIYYLDPTIETVTTAVIVTRNVDNRTAKAAQKFLDFVQEEEQQKIFAQYGFRPVVEGIQLNSIANSPWVENIPGIEINPPVTTVNPPNPQVINEIQRMWNRAP
jgi:ABC-type molybdate transport system substrate-binding protein